MEDPTLISLFVRPLNRLRIPYLVTGGVASTVYGEPRFTRDIDLVIALQSRDARRFADEWPAGEFYVPPVEVIVEESDREEFGHFNLIHHQTSMRADIYLPGNDPLNAWAFEHPVIRQIGEDELVLAPIEAVILSKLRYHQIGKSDRHLRDIHRMLRISGNMLDRIALERWVATLDLEHEWRLAEDHHEE